MELTTITVDRWREPDQSSAGDDRIVRDLLDAKASRALWVTVVGKAIEDFIGGRDSKSYRISRDRIRESARLWLFDRAGDEDFRLVCGMAGLRPEQIRAGVRRLAEAKGLKCDYANISTETGPPPRLHNATSCRRN